MITRREFLKIGAAVTAGAAGLTEILSEKGLLFADAPAGSGRRVATFCELCFWKCGMIATVQDGRITKIEGNPDHPLSNGRLCPRGASALGSVYDRDRLKKPLIREKAPDGSQRFREAEWEEALDVVAKRLQTIVDRHGPDRIALFSHGHGGSFFKTLLSAMGSKMVTAPSDAQCRGPRDVGFKLTFGADVGNPETIDTPNADCIAFIGSHIGENMHNTAVQDLSIAIDRGAALITVDPRFSTVAGKSDYWLPIKPGTDIALLLAWMHVLIGEGIYQKDFIARNAIGLDQLKAHVLPKTPEWAFTVTGIEPDVIRKTARLLARHAPAAFVHPGRHVVWYGNDTQRSRAIALVNALLGNWGKKGGFYLPAKFSLKEPPLPAFPEQKKYHFPESMTYPLASFVPSQEVVKASIPGENGIADGEQIRAWLVYGCNVPLTLPNPAATLKAMQSLDLLVAIDILPAEITGYADVVLPECTFLERFDDLDTRPFRTPFVALRQPVVDPMFDTKPAWWIAKGIARRMTGGGASLDRYFPFSDMEEYLASKAKASGVDFRLLKEKGCVTGQVDTIYDPLDLMTFNTPSKKIELFSNTLKDMGFDPIPQHTPPEEPPDGYYRLLFGRHPAHTFSRTTNNAVSLEIFPENELWIDPELARIHSLKSGSYVVLENQDGVKSGRVRVKITERIRQDCVYMVHGFGHSDRRLSKGFGRGASDSDLVTKYIADPLAGGTGMNVNFVTISKVS